MPADQTEAQPATAPLSGDGRKPRHHGLERLPDAETLYGDPRDLNEQELNRLSKETLLTIARGESLPNRSKMNKAQLARTLRKHLRKAR